MFGAFSPIDGDKFLLKMPHCNADTHQVFPEEFSLQRPQEFKILVPDNGAFYKANHLRVPENIGLLFLPPYSPELNPAENIWTILKRKFTNKLHNTLEEVSSFIIEAIEPLTTDKVKASAGLNMFLKELKCK